MPNYEQQTSVEINQTIKHQLIEYFTAMGTTSTKINSSQMYTFSHVNKSEGRSIVKNLVWQDLVQSVAVTAQCNSTIGRHIVYIYVLVYVNNELTLRVNLGYITSK